MSCNNNFVQIPTVQGDGNNVRGFEVELISNNVQYVVDKENTIVAIAGTKPDTKQVLNECQVTDEGFILVDITSQMSAVPGRGDYSIMLMDRLTNSQLKSFPFYILTTESFNAAEITSSNEFQLLTEKTTKAENSIKEANKAIENVNSIREEVEQAEEERKTAENLRVETEESRVQAELEREQQFNLQLEESQEVIERHEASISQYEESVRLAIETTTQATQNANTATSEANQARDNANTAKQQADESRVRIEQLEERVLSAEELRVESELQREENEIQRMQKLEEMTTATEATKEATLNANEIREDLQKKLESGHFNGKDGLVTAVKLDQMAFSIDDEGFLVLTYEEGNHTAQNFSINDKGELVYRLEE
jgi:hypothetical protein